MERFSVSGNVVDVCGDRVFPGTIEVSDGRIVSIAETPDAHYSTFITPGLVDAHVHIESSMLAPSEFARAATLHGTVATVSDPHEIANVLGIPGVEWMIEDGKRTPFKFFFGAPSCVPATSFETAGACLKQPEIEYLLQKKEIKYLAEVMNFPAVIHRDPEMMAIVETAKKLNKRIDGHSPGLIDEPLKQYASAGIETDHECVTLQEAQQRIALGMKVAIREGSAAKNFEALWPIIKETPSHVFLCSDDKHPDDLVVSHINALLRRLVENGIDRLDALRCATLNPVQHYGLEVGLLREGDPADLVEWNSLETFEAKRTWIDGKLVAEASPSPSTVNSPPSTAHRLPRLQVEPVNQFNTSEKLVSDFKLKAVEGKQVRVIGALDGQLLTSEKTYRFKTTEENFQCDREADVLKIAVVNRYQEAPPCVGLIQHFGLTNGAMASSVAHDSHNIVAVGTSDEMLCRAINLVIQQQGGLSAVIDETEKIIPLPIAGLMSCDDAWTVARDFELLTKMVKENGCPLTSPFMTLSFMALLVIPTLKIGDKGLFNVDSFSLVPLTES